MMTVGMMKELFERFGMNEDTVIKVNGKDISIVDIKPNFNSDDELYETMEINFVTDK